MSTHGTLEQKDGKIALRFERRYRHAPEKVWRALIEPEHLAAWFPAAIHGERAKGAPLRFVFPDDDGPPLTGTIRSFEPPRLLEYTWGDELLRFELSPDGTGCRLVFTTTVDERVNAPRDAGGWHVCLDRMAALLDGAPSEAHDKDRWPELYAGYVARLGLGDFPAFLKGGTPDALEQALHTPGLEGTLFEGPDGQRLALVRASRDAETAEHKLASSTYVHVIEGSYVLHMGGDDHALGAGTELHVPEGLRISARVSAGTRLLVAFRTPG